MADPVYRAPAANFLIAEPLDGLTALYHRPSTMTHVLIEPAPQILSALQVAPATVGELRLALGLKLSDGPVLAERLGELEALGLVLRE
jgi:PqqD family protein of HPr-rel-A system